MKGSSIWDMVPQVLIVMIARPEVHLWKPDTHPEAPSIFV